MNHNKHNISEFSQLCVELKQLYVAITRAKNRIIIYDDRQQASRGLVQDFWKRLGCAELITKDVLEGKSVQVNAEKSGLNVSKAMLQVKSGLEAWKKQGFRMMKLKYYEQAIFCFKKSSEAELEKRASIFFMAFKAKEDLEDGQREQLFLEQGVAEYSGLPNSAKKLAGIEISKKIKAARKQFSAIGDMFAEFGKFKAAAKCYFSSMNYERAADMHLSIGNKRAAAECYYIVKDYEKALALFLDIGEIMSAIECCDLLEDVSRVLSIVE